MADAEPLAHGLRGPSAQPLHLRARQYEIYVSRGPDCRVFVVIPPLPQEHEASHGTIGFSDSGDPIIVIAHMRLRLEDCSFASRVLLYSGRPAVLVEVGPSSIRETLLSGHPR